MSLLLMLAGCGNDVSVQHYNEPPTASIQSPPNGTTKKEGEVIDFIGTVNDDQTPSNELFVQWSSDIDGVLTNEDPCSVSGSCTYSTGQLTPGNHTVTLAATDENGEVAEMSIQLTVEDVPDAPTITMVHPAQGEVGTEEEDFTFMVQVSDEQDEPGAMYLSFAYEGEAGLTEFCTPPADATGIAACEAALPGGTQHLLFTVTDSTGESDVAEVHFVVTPARRSTTMATASRKPSATATTMTRFRSRAAPRSKTAPTTTAMARSTRAPTPSTTMGTATPK